MKTIVTLFGLRNIQDHSTAIEKVRRGFDIDTVDSGGRTLLMEAVVQNEPALVEFLIEAGADVNIRDKRGWTALHFAAQRHDVTSAERLIQNGADVNIPDSYENSVISTAVYNSRGRGDMIELLRASGADENAKNKSGISALDLAKTISNYDVAQFFE